MMKIPLQELKQKILEKTAITEEELQGKVKQKMSLLSGLISEEGACHIIANELGIKLVEQTNGKLQIKNVLSGMRNVEIVGKASAVAPIKEFAVGSRQGKLASFTLADESGAVRVVLWNDQADNITNINEGTIVQLSGAYVKENNGRKEVHCNDRTKLELNPPGIQIGSVAALQQPQKARKAIKDLTEQDQNVEILGTIVQVSDPKFYPSCPECKRKPREEAGKFICATHQEVTPTHAALLNLFLDDGTENIRTVFFTNQMERLLNKSMNEIAKYKDAPETFADIKTDLLGQQLKVVGKVNNNQMFGRMEFTAQLVFLNPDPEEEIKRLNAAVQESIG